MPLLRHWPALSSRPELAVSKRDWLRTRPGHLLSALVDDELRGHPTDVTARISDLQPVLTISVGFASEQNERRIVRPGDPLVGHPRRVA